MASKGANGAKGAKDKATNLLCGTVAVGFIPFAKLLSTTGGKSDVSALDAFAANQDDETRKFIKKQVGYMEELDLINLFQTSAFQSFFVLKEFIAVAEQLLADHSLTLDSLPLAANGMRNKSHTNLGDCGRVSVSVIQEASRYVETALRPKGATVVTRTLTRTTSTATDGTVSVETTVSTTVVSHHGITRGGNARGAIKNGKRIPNRSTRKISDV